MLWRARKLLGILTLSAKKYGGLSLKKKEGRVRVERSFRGKAPEARSYSFLNLVSDVFKISKISSS